MSAIDRLRLCEHPDLRGDDTCESCAHGASETLRGRNALGAPTPVLLVRCTEPSIVALHGGVRPSAGTAREYACNGRLHRRGASA